MRNPLPHMLRRKTRWFRQADAYVDGRVTPVERDLFEERLEESPALQDHVRETRDLKQLFSTLPEHPAPRSFAINPGMLAEFDRAYPPKAPRVALRLAQATAVVALASLATVGFIDASGNSSGGDGSDGGVAPASNGAEEFSNTEDEGLSGGSNGAAPAGTPVPEGGAGVDSMDDISRGEDDAGGTDGDANGGESAQDSEQSRPADEGAEPQDGNRSAPVSSLAEQREANGDSARTAIYATLASITVLAIGVWIYARRQLRGYR